MSNITSACPFAKASSTERGCPMKFDQNRDRQKTRDEEKVDKNTNDSGIVAPKCPFGYDSHTFKLGPLSCMICKALLYQSSKCMPCAHKFCKACVSRFRDCPLCGADIENIEPDLDLQATVDRFINGHARIRRSQLDVDGKEVKGEQRNVIYADVSMERGAFLVQQAMRAFHGKNIESAKSRLSLCEEDIRGQLEMADNKPELYSQLGAVLGMLGDCCRGMGDANGAIPYYEESVEFLLKMPAKDMEVVHTLSVSLNKIGDLKYYEGDLQSAKSYYARALDVRRNAVKENNGVPSQVVDVAISLAKVADLDRNLGNEDGAIGLFQEAIKQLESLKLNSSETALEKRRDSVLEFLHNQLSEKQESAHVSTA